MDSVYSIVIESCKFVSNHHSICSNNQYNWIQLVQHELICLHSVMDVHRGVILIKLVTTKRWHVEASAEDKHSMYSVSENKIQYLITIPHSLYSATRFTGSTRIALYILILTWEQWVKWTE